MFARRMRAMLAVAAILLSFGFTAPVRVRAQSAALTGVVRSTDGIAIGAARVRAVYGDDASFSTTTDAEGHFTLAVDSARIIRVSVSARGYADRTFDAPTVRDEIARPARDIWTILLAQVPDEAPAPIPQPTTAIETRPLTTIVQSSVFGFYTPSQALRTPPFYGRYTYVLFPVIDARAKAFLTKIATRYISAGQPVVGPPVGIENTRDYNLFAFPALESIAGLTVDAGASADAFVSKTMPYYDTTAVKNLWDSYCTLSTIAFSACAAPRPRGPFLLISLAPFTTQGDVQRGATVVPCDLSSLDESDFDTALDKIQLTYASPLKADTIVSMPVVMTDLSPALFKVQNALDAVFGKIVAVVEKLPAGQ